MLHLGNGFGSAACAGEQGDEFLSHREVSGRERHERATAGDGGLRFSRLHEQPRQCALQTGAMRVVREEFGEISAQP